MSYNASSTNPTDSLSSVVTGSDEFDKYFVSPAIIGADFFNVYSNAIFFSQQGDGKATSWHEYGEDWLNGTLGDSYDVPCGIYYIPKSIVSGGSYICFSTRDTNGTTGAYPLMVGGVYGITGSVIGNINFVSTHNGLSLSSYLDMTFAVGRDLAIGVDDDFTLNATGASFATTSLSFVATGGNASFGSIGGTLSLGGSEGVTISSSAQGITLDSHGHFALSGDYSIALTAGDDIALTASDDISITASTGSIDLSANTFLDLGGGAGIRLDPSGPLGYDSVKTSMNYVLCLVDSGGKFWLRRVPQSEFANP
jgi:hypothetical protein